MVILVTGGVGYYQEEGQPAQIGQILIATDGIGYHQIEGQPVEVLHPGDVTFCPPGVKHWHGGSADTAFAHIAVNTNPELKGLEWFDRISENEYAQLAAE